jgi:hypothetical protein
LSHLFPDNMTKVTDSAGRCISTKATKLGNNIHGTTTNDIVYHHTSCHKQNHCLMFKLLVGHQQVNVYLKLFKNYKIVKVSPFECH